MCKRDFMAAGLTLVEKNCKGPKCPADGSSNRDTPVGGRSRNLETNRDPHRPEPGMQEGKCSNLYLSPAEQLPEIRMGEAQGMKTGNKIV